MRAAEGAAGGKCGGRRWVALGAFGLSSAANAFLFMDFSTTTALSRSVLGANAEQIE